MLTVNIKAEINVKNPAMIPKNPTEIPAAKISLCGCV